MPSEEFTQLADSVLGHIKSHLGPGDLMLANNIHYEVEGAAQNWHKDATGTPHDYTLLGMYQEEPTPRITIFEESIRRLANMFGGLQSAIHECLTHELFQHGFGYDHTKETQQMGIIPAFAVKTDTGKELEQWHL